MLVIFIYSALTDLSVRVLVGTRSPMVYCIKLDEDIPILKAKHIPTSNRKITLYVV